MMVITTTTPSTSTTTTITTTTTSRHHHHSSTPTSSSSFNRSATATNNIGGDSAIISDDNNRIDNDGDDLSSSLLEASAQLLVQQPQEPSASSDKHLLTRLENWITSLDQLDLGLLLLAVGCVLLCLVARFAASFFPQGWRHWRESKRKVQEALNAALVISGVTPATVITQSQQQQAPHLQLNYSPAEQQQHLFGAAGQQPLTSLTVTTSSSSPMNNNNSGQLPRVPSGPVSLSQLAAIERTSLDWLNTAMIWMHSFEVGIFSASALHQWFDAMNAEAANLAAQNRHHGLTVKFRELASSQTPPIVTSIVTERVVEDQDVKRFLLLCVEWRDFSLPTLVCRDEDLLAVPVSPTPSNQGEPPISKETEAKMYNIAMLVRHIKAKVRICVEPMSETGEVYLTIAYANPPDMTFDVKPTVNTDFPYHINLIHLSELLDLCVRSASIRVCIKSAAIFDPSSGAFLSQHMAKHLFDTRSRDSGSDDGRLSPRAPKKPPRLINKQQMLVKVISASFNHMLPAMQKQRNLPFMDAYCIILTEPPFEKQVTSIVQNTASPFWDEHFIVYIDDETTTLILNLYDNLRPENDSQIGAVRIDVDQIRSDADFFRQPVMLDILTTIVEQVPADDEGGSGEQEEERAVIVGQLTVAAELLAPANEIRRRGSIYREGVPQEEKPPLPSSIVFPKRSQHEPIASSQSPSDFMSSPATSMYMSPSSMLNASTMLNPGGASGSMGTRSQLSVNSYSVADNSRLDLSLQPTIPENVPLGHSQSIYGESPSISVNMQSSLARIQQSEQGSAARMEPQASTASSRSHTIKISVPKLSTVVAESKSLMRKPTVTKIKRNINNLQHSIKKKIEKAGSHLSEARLSSSYHSSGALTPPPDSAAGPSDPMTNSAIVPSSPHHHKPDKSLKQRLMATLNRLQPHSSTRALSVDRGSELFANQKKHGSTSAIAETTAAAVTSSSSERGRRSPRFFTERLSKTAKSLSSSLRKLIVDIQSPLVSCGGGRSSAASSSHNKHHQHHRNNQNNKSRDAFMRQQQTIMRDGESPTVISRTSTPSLELEFSTVSAVPGSPWAAASDKTSSDPADDADDRFFPESPPFTAPDDQLSSTGRNFVGGRTRAAINSGSSGGAPRRPSLFDSSMMAVGQRQAQYRRHQQQAGQQGAGGLLIAPPPGSASLDGSSSSDAAAPATVASALRKSGVAPPSPGRTRAMGSSVVTFSPAPFRKTRDGYEQATL